MAATFRESEVCLGAGVEGREGGKSPLDDDGAVSGVEADFDRWPLSIGMVGGGGGGM